MAYNHLGKEYLLIHQWLGRNHGKPRKCAKCFVKGYIEQGGRWSIHYALKKGLDHKRDVENYLPLCRSCHRKYDMTSKERARLKALSENQTPEQLAKLSVKRSIIAKARARNKYGQYIATTT